MQQKKYIDSNFQPTLTQNNKIQPMSCSELFVDKIGTTYLFVITFCLHVV